MPGLPDVGPLFTIALVCTIAVGRGSTLSLGYGRVELMGTSFVHKLQLYPITRLTSVQDKPSRKYKRGQQASAVAVSARGGNPIVLSCTVGNIESYPYLPVEIQRKRSIWKYLNKEMVDLQALWDTMKWVRAHDVGRGFNSFPASLLNQKPFHFIGNNGRRRKHPWMRFGGGEQQWTTNTIIANGPYNVICAAAAALGFPRLVKASTMVATLRSPATVLKLPIVSGDRVGATRVGIRLLLWLGLFLFSAMLHSAEIAITTLYPWKVKEFAEEEGERSPFQTLNSDVTRVLTTILFTTTMCSIYSAALFTNIAVQAFGSGGLAYSTGALTIITLFFGELLPKALGVSNPEMVTRALMPIINILAVIVSPVGLGFSKASKFVLGLFGCRSEEGGAVSEEALRLIVMGASKSGGIEKDEASMVEAVLDLNDTKVSQVMCPRMEVVAIDQYSTLRDLHALVLKDKYSRIPVYDGTVDNITGVVLSKVLLEYLSPDSKTTALDETIVADVMEPPFFVPETGSVGRVLEEMKARRLHQATVVDEYGGTSGIVTLEDIIEEVVGEIYDEEDDEAFKQEGSQIALNDDGTYAIQGTAHIEDVCLSLDIPKVTPDDLREFGTLSGYLCSQADTIPEIGDEIRVGDYIFTVTLADERRIIEVKAKLAEDEEKSNEAGTTDEPIQNKGSNRGTDSIATIDPSS